MRAAKAASPCWRRLSSGRYLHLWFYALSKGLVNWAMTATLELCLNKSVCKTVPLRRRAVLPDPLLESLQTLTTFTPNPLQEGLTGNL